MSIANELSTDVAAAMLTPRDGETPADSSELKDVVMKVHTTLRHLTVEARKKNRRTRIFTDESSAGNAASNHY
jgi:hypothetical protein